MFEFELDWFDEFMSAQINLNKILINFCFDQNILYHCNFVCLNAKLSQTQILLYINEI